VSNEITGLVGLQTKNLACTGQQLIPDPLGCRSSDERNNANLMDLGSDLVVVGWLTFNENQN